MIKNIAELVREKTIEGISELRDESDRDGIRVVVELKRGEIAQVILNNLYKHTQMETTFGIIMLALCGVGTPRTLQGGMDIVLAALLWLLWSLYSPRRARSASGALGGLWRSLIPPPAVLRRGVAFSTGC